MKSFAERNPMLVGIAGIGLTAAAVLGAVEYNKLPLFNTGKHYSAYFAEAGGLTPGSPVQVAGYKVGDVLDVALDGNRVLVDFKVDQAIRLGNRTEAAIKTKTLLGARALEVSPRGDGQLSGPIPRDRTTSPYELPDALGDLSRSIEGVNSNQLNSSLMTLSQAFESTPADLRAAFDGLARFSDVLGKRDTQLRQMLTDANKATGVLRERSDQIVTLVRDSKSLLAQFRTQSAALDQISGNIAALSKQISGLVADNRTQLRPALEKLNTVLKIVDDHKVGLQESIKMLSEFSLSLGEAVASAPFFKSYVVNIAPGQIMQPFIDAAFSDLGVDPSTLLPSQLTEPQIGQPATPGLPMPYPRTGQGGPPAINLPDAITGNPGDPRYPYRPPAPQPPAGGPPPGPPPGFNPAAPPAILNEPTSAEVAPPQYQAPLPGQAR